MRSQTEAKMAVGVRRAKACAVICAGFALLLLAGLRASAQAPAGDTIRNNQRLKPFRVIGNVYYIGFSNVGVFLITTPQGHILLDSGYTETVPWIRGNIEQLGFKVSDIKIILNTHAHSDHVGGVAQLKEWTGAKFLTSEADAPVIADGGRSDFRSDGRELWKPTKADGIVRDGEEVRLGGMTLVAHLTPGHTKGNISWTTVAEEGGRKYNVVFVGGMRLNPGVPLVGNAKYPPIADDYAKGFATLKSLPCDVFLAMHADFYGLPDKMKRLEQGAQPNPFIDPQGYRKYIEGTESAFLDQLAKERPNR